MEHCVKCGKPLETVIITAYGERRCEDCYDDYLMTDKGKVEYLISLASGELDLKDYDADFLGHVAVCWNTYRCKLKMTNGELMHIEEKARELGLL